MIETKQETNEILFISSYPPRACGIATYTNDLIKAIKNKYDQSLSIKVCAIESEKPLESYPEEVKYVLDPSSVASYIKLAYIVNNDPSIKKVFIQHEFGLFGGEYGEYLLQFLYFLKKPVSITFHTVLPEPNEKRKQIIHEIVNCCDEIVVMTKHASDILQSAYTICQKQITLIPHGTHTISWHDKHIAKENHEYSDRLVLSTFGLMSSNKSLQMAIEAMPKIVEQIPNAIYLVLGKTHPEVLKKEGEIYRGFLEGKVLELGMQDHVQFVNQYLSLEELLEFLRITDVYLFTSKDPLQTVSGTFAYAMSCACPIISTPIPHAKEMLQDNSGFIVDFHDSEGMANAAIRLLKDEELRYNMGRNAFHQTRATVWENSAISHVNLFNSYLEGIESSGFNLPEINLNHIHALTDKVGMIQFSDISSPDIESGYTLDDNARALISVCTHYELTGSNEDLPLIRTYLNFIEFCQLPEGNFLNYVNKNKTFDLHNGRVNLEDSNGRAIWALGVVLSNASNLPNSIIEQTESIFEKAIPKMLHIGSPRAIAFIIKGMYHFLQKTRNKRVRFWIENFADKLLDKYNSVSNLNWRWFEEYLTYANSILPEAMLYAHLVTGHSKYKTVAHATFDFLLSHLFVNGAIKVVSNDGWHFEGSTPKTYGEQPIDVSYTIQTLELFYKTFKDETYRQKMDVAFSWFLGNNHLNQIIYNPATGGCYDGLEEHSINLNQGAESTVCYLMARLVIERNKNKSIQKRIKRIRPKRELIFSTRTIENGSIEQNKTIEI